MPLLLLLGLYLSGLTRLWARAGIGRGVSVAVAGAHGGGLLVLFFALIWPLDAFAEWSLAAHMTQHMLLIAVAAPLLIVGRTGTVCLAGVPKRWIRRATAHLRRPLVARAAVALSGTGTATLLQTAVMWGWHLPAAMQLALAHDLVHYAMHASFLGAGLLFWWALLQSLRERRRGFGSGALALVGTMMQMGLLSALLTFAPAPRFEHYLGRTEALGLTALEDQQLAGLIMWVPSALPYLLGALLLMAAWLRRIERDDTYRVRRSGHEHPR